MTVISLRTCTKFTRSNLWIIIVPSGPPPLLPEILRDAEELPLPPSLDAPPTPAKSNQAETSSKSTASPRNIDESKAEKLSRLLKLGGKR